MPSASDKCCFQAWIFLWVRILQCVLQNSENTIPETIFCQVNTDTLQTTLLAAY